MKYLNIYIYESYLRNTHTFTNSNRIMIMTILNTTQHKFDATQERQEYGMEKNSIRCVFCSLLSSFFAFLPLLSFVYLLSFLSFT